MWRRIFLVLFDSHFAINSCLVILFFDEQIAAEVGGALSQCNRVVMVSQGDGPLGAAKLTNEVIEIMNKINASAQELTGRTAVISVSLFRN